MKAWKIPLYKVFMADEVDESIVKTLHSGWIGEGSCVVDFEFAVSRYLQTSNLLCVNSCTSAMELALKLIGDNQEGEIITNPIACFASISAIIAQGLTPRFADIDPGTGNLNLEDVKSKINDKTKGILVVHFCGQPMNVDGLHQHSWVIEDCAQSLGSERQGIKVGSCDGKGIKCLSFQSVKTLTTVDGGSIVLPNKELFDRARKLRWYGLSRQENRYSQDIKESGYKFIMNDVSATIGLANMLHLDRLVEIHRNNWRYYRNKLSNQSGIKLMREDEGSISACPLFPILVEDKEKFHKMMESKGIQVDLPHGLCTEHSCVKNNDYLYEASNFYSKLTSIPAGWWIGQKEIDYVIDAIKDGW